MQSIWLVFVSSEFGEDESVQSVYFSKEKAEAEAKVIQNNSDLIAYVEERDISDSV